MPGRCLQWHAIAGSAALALAFSCAVTQAYAARPDDPGAVSAAATPAPAPAAGRQQTQPTSNVPVPSADPARITAERLKKITAVKSWGYQVVGLNVSAVAGSPLDMIVVDVSSGLDSDRPLRAEDVVRLKRKPDGKPRLVIGYLSIGDAEAYRADLFAAEYLTDDAPDWLGPEHAHWRGNRIVRFCHEGWQRTVIGDDNGRSVYNAIDPSPLHRIVDLGLDGVMLDRADVWSEVKQECPGGEKAMADFVARIAASARRQNPGFLVVMQNAEDLVRQPKVLEAIDAIAKEDLFTSGEKGQELRPQPAVKASIGHLKRAKEAGRPVFVIDYVLEQGKRRDAHRRIEAEGFVPYIAPRDLDRLWLPGRDF